MIETKIPESILIDFLFTHKLQSLFMFDIAQSKHWKIFPISDMVLSETWAMSHLSEFGQNILWAVLEF